MSDDGLSNGLPVLVSYSNYGYVAFAKNLLLNLNSNAPNHRVHFY